MIFLFENKTSFYKATQKLVKPKPCLKGPTKGPPEDDYVDDMLESLQKNQTETTYKLKIIRRTIRCAFSPFSGGGDIMFFLCGSKAAVIEAMMEKHDFSPLNKGEGRFGITYRQLSVQKLKSRPGQ